jgi:hypothetical protein
MSRWTPDKRASPFGPTTRAERVQRAVRSRYKRRNRQRRAVGGDRKTKSDWPALSLKGRSASMLPYDHPAAMDGRTIYPTTVMAVSDETTVLKSGSNQWKLGSKVLKGHWAGFPIFALTLEERSHVRSPVIIGARATATGCIERTECSTGRIWNGDWK